MKAVDGDEWPHFHTVYLLPLASGATATIRILIYGLKAICFRFDEILTLLLKCAVSAALPRPDEL